MSTTAAAPRRTFRQRWHDFWFAPGDPTMLGFIRIVAGLLVLYLHLCYTVDLNRFFGPYAWYSQEDVNRERLESPIVVPEFWSWEENKAMARLPEYPHRKKAVVNFIRNLPADSMTRAADLHYLVRLIDFRSAEAIKLGLQYVLRLPEASAERDKQLARLIDDPDSTKGGRGEMSANRVPTFFATLTKEEREKVAEDVRRFWAVLPPGGTIGESHREYVLYHLYEMDFEQLKAFTEFILTLPADQAERTKQIDYLARWNADPRRVTRIGSYIFSMWFHVSDTNWMMAIHLGALAIIALFTAGLCTRVTSVLTWMIALGYIHRSQQVLFGMDTMMSILLFYLMIGNSGAALSVDRLIARYRAARASLRRTGGIDDKTRTFLANPLPSASAAFAIRCIQIHFCYIYLASGLSKLKGPAWWGGTAIWDVLINPEFTLLRYPWYESLLRTGIDFKPVYYFGIAIGAWFTLFLEIGTPFLVWTRLRPLMVALGVVLHAQISMLMGLNLFEMMMMTMLLAYIPGCVVREWLRGPKTDVKALSYRFDCRAAAQTRSAAVIAAVDVDEQVKMEPTTGQEVPALLSDGKPVPREAGVGTLIGTVRLLKAVRFLFWLPGLKWLLTLRVFPMAGSSEAASGGSGRLSGPARSASAS